MKKFLSIALALMMVVSLFALTSCEKEPKEMLDEAAKVLNEKPYTMTMKMNFNSDNAELKEVFDMMNMEIPVTIDGDNMAMDMTMDMMGESMTAKIALVDKVMYYNMDIAGMAMKVKSNLTDAQMEEFMGENGAEMPVDYTQFAELKAEKKDGKTVITCTGLSDEGKKAINDEMASALEATGGTAELGEFSFTITLKDGKYDSMDLTCAYTVTVLGETLSASVSMSAAFTYDNVAAVKAPDDAADYQDMPFDQIFGE